MLFRLCPASFLFRLTLAVAFLSGVALIAKPVQGGERGSPKPSAQRTFTVAKFQGTWNYKSCNVDGVATPKEQLAEAKSRLTIEKDTLRLWERGIASSPAIITLPNGDGTREVDFNFVTGQVALAIFERDGDILRLAYGLGERPTDFNPRKGVAVVELALVK